MSSVLSIPDVVDSTIKNALKKSAAAGGSDPRLGGPGGKKIKGVFAFAKSHTFTLIGIIAVALVVAVGIYMGMQHMKKKKKALNTDEAALAENDFVSEDEEDYDEDDDDEEAGERRPLVARGKKSGGGPSPAEEEGPVDDPNWTPLDALSAPDDG